VNFLIGQVDVGRTLEENCGGIGSVTKQWKLTWINRKAWCLWNKA